LPIPTSIPVPGENPGGTDQHRETLKRITVIKHTSFIPAVYTIAELAAAGVIGILFFVKIDSWYKASFFLSSFLPCSSP
jgi:hypothetical protein